MPVSLSLKGVRVDLTQPVAENVWLRHPWLVFHPHRTSHSKYVDDGIVPEILASGPLRVAASHHYRVPRPRQVGRRGRLVLAMHRDIWTVLGVRTLLYGVTAILDIGTYQRYNPVED